MLFWIIAIAIMVISPIVLAFIAATLVAFVILLGLPTLILPRIKAEAKRIV